MGFSMRIREWYSYHFPELIKVVPDNYLFARCAQFIKNRKELTDESVPLLEEIVMDHAKAQTILDASRSSMGMDISPIDLINIERFAKRVIALVEHRKELQEYLRSKMHTVAPNLSALIRDTVAARLISKAGSLTNLAKSPASTVQILGAEKALFRALKTKGNTPKYGLIYHSTFIGRADAKNKGRISRYLANKCSMGTRIDSFSDDPCAIYGEKLREQVEERLTFYETGANPRKNIDVMEQVAKSLAKGKSEDSIDDGVELNTPKSKKKKDKQKRKSMQMDIEESDVSGKKHKSAKKEKKESQSDSAMSETEDKSPKKAKKSSKKKSKKKL